MGIVETREDLGTLLRDIQFSSKSKVELPRSILLAEERGAFQSLAELYTSLDQFCSHFEERTGKKVKTGGKIVNTPLREIVYAYSEMIKNAIDSMREVAQNWDFNGDYRGIVELLVMAYRGTFAMYMKDNGMGIHEVTEAKVNNGAMSGYLLGWKRDPDLFSHEEEGINGRYGFRTKIQDLGGKVMVRRRQVFPGAIVSVTLPLRVIAADCPLSLYR